jgi:hypothetical protein
MHTGFWQGNPKESGNLEEPGVNERIGRYGLDWLGSGYGQVAGSCKQGNEPSGSINCRVFLDWLRTGQVLGRTMLHGASKQSNEIFWKPSNWGLLRDIRVHGSIILELSFDGWVNCGYWTYVLHGRDSYDKSNHSAGHVRGKEIISDLQFLKKHSLPRSWTIKGCDQQKFMSSPQGFTFFL